MDLGYEYLKTANKDLKAAHTLYEYKLYPQAVFYFCQSVEKANKALALITGDFSEEYFANKVRHDSTKIYQLGIVEQRKKYVQTLENINSYPELTHFPIFEKTNIDNLISETDVHLREIARIRKEKNDYADLSGWDINAILQSIDFGLNEIENDINTLLNTQIDKDEWAMEIQSIVIKLRSDNTDFSNYLAEELDRLKGEDLENIWSMIQKISILLSQRLSVFLPLYYFTLIVLPHTNATRYPEKGCSPSNIYNSKKPLVKKLPILIAYHSETLKDLTRFRKEWDSFSPKIESNNTEL